MHRMGWLAALLICVTAHAANAENDSAASGTATPAATAAADTGACTHAFTAPIAGTVLDASELAQPRGRVTDMTGALSVDCQSDLSRRLAELELQTGDQLAVLIVPSTGDDTIEQFATQIFERWKLGQKKVDNGILLVAALHDRHVRIEVGYGLEGTIPDVLAGRIIRERIVPAFKDRNYEAGISAAVDALTQRLAVQPSQDQQAQTADASSTTPGQPVEPLKSPKPEPRPRYDGPLFWIGLGLLNVGAGVYLARRRKSRRAAWPFVTSLLANMVVMIVWLPFDTFGDGKDGLAGLFGACFFLGPAAMVFGLNLYRSRLLRKWTAIYAGIVALGTVIGCLMHYAFDQALLIVGGSVLALIGAAAALIAKINGTWDSSPSSSKSSSNGSLLDAIFGSSNNDSGWGGGGGSSGGGGASDNW
ncbi:TPM domain-containing protein [Burkholderia sp. Ax-1719]|uniref:TPM domain-containing protein n=1 Tax=Burkholderia sp. Ax-1719 TaxID=2608334 RepID=UPI00141EFAAE|nr:TPM domain-containing protein [Burkholderia sp. Ax-1719]NIE69095.1 hypothetical protein [Burkholderia sp. Ax-1719]